MPKGLLATLSAGLVGFAACGGPTRDQSSVTVRPTSVIVAPATSVTFTATVQSAASAGVRWTVLEAGGGTVDGVGHYTAPTPAGTYHVVATSVADATKSGTATVNVVVSSGFPVIDEAQLSGVAGFPIGVFGSGFGATQGSSTLTILGVPATITSWSDGAIQALVPSATPGTGDLAVTIGGVTAAAPFTVYTIDPAFLSSPARFENLILKRPVVISGSYTDFSTNGTHAPAFLSYNSFDGAADLTFPATIAMPLGGAVNETVWFSWMGNSSWYDHADVQGKQPPTSYALEASADSTDGVNGSWAQVLAVANNAKWGRSHRVALTGQRWLRWQLQSGTTPSTRVMEVRVYRVKPGSTGTGYDAWGVLGDSITADDLNHAGDLAFWGRVMNARADGTEMLPLVMGLSGSKTAPLTAAGNTDTASTSLLTAMALEPDVRYWGIALGINDYGYPDASTTAATDRANLDEGIRTLIGAGKVPVLIRIADTIDSEVSPPTTPTMKKLILANQDELAAQYRLIPGPDFYTFFRLHPSSIRGDGIHHNSGDFNEEILWSQAIVASGIYGP